MKLTDSWKTVVIEPTDEMIDAGTEVAICVTDHMCGSYLDNPEEVFKAMLAKSPERVPVDNKQSEDSWEYKGTVVYFPRGQGGFCLKGCPEPRVMAEKIVRAVNACKGVSTDMLHEGDYKAMIETNTALTVHMNQLSDALRKYEEAFDDLFGSCFSNGVFNAWGGPVNCTNLNEAHYMAGKALGK